VCNVFFIVCVVLCAVFCLSVVCDVCYLCNVFFIVCVVLCAVFCLSVVCEVCYLCVVSYCSTTASGLKPISSYNK
jgi:hypothetical protein